MKRLFALVLLRIKSWYWAGACVMDRTGGTKHPGMVLAVGDINAHMIPFADSGGDTKAAAAAWDRLFPGWNTSVVLLVFYPASNRTCTQTQFVKALEDMNQLKDMTTDEVKAAYQRIPMRRTLWVPSCAMRRVCYREFKRYWKAALPKEKSHDS